MVNHPNRSRRTVSPAANPAPADIRSAREKAGLTQAQAAALVYKSAIAWQKWEDSGPSGRRMDPAIWESWLAKTGLGPAIKKISE